MPQTFHDKLTFHARHSLEEAANLARFTHSPLINIEHFLLALFLEKGSLGSILLRSMGFEGESLSALCLKKYPDLAPVGVGDTLPLSEPVKDIVRRAYSLASEFQYPYVGTEHLVYALMEIESVALDNMLDALGIDDKKIEATLSSHMSLDQLPSLGKILEASEGVFTSKKEKGETPFLDQFTVDMTAASRTNPTIFIGREEELDRLMQTLSRKNKNNPLLLGEPGVGKTALVSALAQRITSGKVPHYLSNKRVLSLDLALTVAGTNFRGEFENRLKEIIREATENPDTILFIDEIHTLVGAGNTQGGLDAANILKPALARGEIRCIGATTFGEYKKHIEKDPALERRFQAIALTEPSPEEALRILLGVRSEYELFHGIALPEPLVRRAVDLSVRYIHDRFLPDKAFDIIDEASALARHSLPVSKEMLSKGELETRIRGLEEEKQAALRDERYDEAASLRDRILELSKTLETLTAKLAEKSAVLPVLEKSHIDKTVARMSNIPLAVIANDNPRERIVHLQKALTKNLMGQAAVIDELTHTLTQVTLGRRAKDKPLASFLFLGPTGVGKTFTAKLLAEHFFGSQKSLIRFDMSEFGERHSVAQMLGAPAGYVGYGEGGKLTEAVRKHPYSVILFDEIEKAHPDVFNILLQILDEGTLTDAEGRRVDFRNTLIILTSNQGSEHLTTGGRIGFQSDEETTKKNIHTSLIQKSVEKAFRPEILARIHTSLIFAPLSEAALLAITKHEGSLLLKHFAQEGITITVAPAVYKKIVAESSALTQGARLVHKNIQKLLERPIITALLAAPDATHFAVTLATPTVTKKASGKKAAQKETPTEASDQNQKDIIVCQPVPRSKK
jgi:ATP-dependent Clp protease ATP-binding subunit ClpC